MLLLEVSNLRGEQDRYPSTPAGAETDQAIGVPKISNFQVVLQLSKSATIAL